MDQKPESGNHHPLAVTGAGVCVLDGSRGEQADRSALRMAVLPWLKSRKSLKFMGKQDRLAVVAAGIAIGEADAGAALLNRRTGVYLTVSYIPFERADVEIIARHSIRDGRFSMEEFSTNAVEQVNPLMTFRCLPNMPIYHTSLNFGIQGPYFVTYPGVGQFYLALERAGAALRRGEIDLALVGGVADQRNFLIQRHFAKFPHTKDWNFADAAGFLCLELATSAERRLVSPRIDWNSCQVDYEPPDFDGPLPEHLESARMGRRALPTSQPGHLGPASLPVLLATLLESRMTGEVIHEVGTMDGLTASSRWRVR